MSVALNRITGLKSGETVLTEEQVKTGYEVDIHRSTDRENFDSVAGTAGDALTEPFGGDQDADLWYILSENHGANGIFHKTPGGYTGYLVIPANTLLILNFRARRIEIKNRVAGKNAVYNISRFFFL